MDCARVQRSFNTGSEWLSWSEFLGKDTPDGLLFHRGGDYERMKTFLGSARDFKPGTFGIVDQCALYYATLALILISFLLIWINFSRFTAYWIYIWKILVS